MNRGQKELYNVKLNEKEMAFLELVCVSNGLTYPSTNDELISVLESKIPIGVSMAVIVRYYEQEITRMQILLRAYKVFDIQQKGKAILKADFRKRHGLDNKDDRNKLCESCKITIVTEEIYCESCVMTDEVIDAENKTKIVKHITWLSADKIMGWVDGHGPYTDVSIRAYIRDNPTIEFIERISTN